MSDNQRKFAVAEAWCQACDWHFRIVTDADCYIVKQVDFEQFVDAVRLEHVLAFLNESPAETKPAQTR